MSEILTKKIWCMAFLTTSLDRFIWKKAQISAEIWTAICGFLTIWILDVQISDIYCMLFIKRVVKQWSYQRQLNRSFLKNIIYIFDFINEGTIHPSRKFRDFFDPIPLCHTKCVFYWHSEIWTPEIQTFASSDFKHFT